MFKPWKKPEVETPSVEMDQVGKDLMAAAQYIREHGWCQNTLDEADGRVCVQGAIAAVTESKTPRTGCYNSARSLNANSALRGYLGQYTHHWNDQRCRTKDEVIQALEQCALTRINALIAGREGG